MGKKLTRIGGRVLRWLKGQRFPPGFDEWCHLASPYSVKFEQPPTLQVIEKEHPSADSHYRVREFIRAVTEEGKHWTTLGLYLESRYVDGDWIFQFPMSGGNSAPLVAENTHALEVHFSNSSGHFRGDLRFVNLRTQALRIDLRGAKNPIQLINCVVGRVILPNLSESRAETLIVQMHDCWIGTLVLHSKSLTNLAIRGGGIAQIECPSSDSANPFTGAVSFKNVVFPFSPTETRFFQGPQAYRSLYAHLKKLDNTLMANLMRSHQLRAERADEHGFTKLANWIYGTFANYGMSPGRPLWWLGCTYILAVIGCYNFDSGMLLQSFDSYIGAYSALLNENGGR